jgi:hypothetical protein
MPSAAATGLLAPWIGGSPSINVGPCVSRIVKQIAQRNSIWSMPFELTFVCARDTATGQADAVVHEVPEHAVHRPTFLENLEDEANRRLCLLVGIQHYLAGRAAYIAHGRAHPELAATGLGELSLEHALFEHMQLGLGHRAFES